MRISKYFTVSKSNLKIQQNDRPDTPNVCTLKFYKIKVINIITTEQ
jgi:hypothetical protein